MARQFKLIDREAALLAISRLSGRALHAVVMSDDDDFDMTVLADMKNLLLRHIPPKEARINAWKRIDGFSLKGVTNIRKAVKQLYLDVAKCNLGEQYASDLLLRNLSDGIEGVDSDSVKGVTGEDGSRFCYTCEWLRSQRLPGWYFARQQRALTPESKLYAVVEGNHAAMDMAHLDYMWAIEEERDLRTKIARWIRRRIDLYHAVISDTSAKIRIL